ncbi:MAG TPA: DUF4249 family protein [Flavobacteriales bacterium]|nr:DUF4249 family protein [Flavobacteriales bacterium]
MKKIAIFLLLISAFFMACETDFEVNASWKEVTVVYGLLDQSQPQQYIKINKAYLGEGDALQMASVADSVNYNPEDLEVKIFKVKDGAYGSIDTLGFVTLYDTILEKDTGLFSTDENIIYTTPSNFFLTNNADEKDYILSIYNKKTKRIVSAKSNLIHELNLDIPPSKPMGFYGIIPNPVVLPLDKSQTTVNWYHAKNGKIYQIIARIYYKDYFYNDTILNYIDWTVHPDPYDGSSEMHYTFEGDVFVNTLATKITNTDITLIARRLSHVELFFTVGSEDLHTYMAVNEPFEGIVQERPVFTNINNGIGLFSCRYNKSHSMSFPSSTREGLAIDLGSLHFIYP